MEMADIRFENGTKGYVRCYCNVAGVTFDNRQKYLKGIKKIAEKKDSDLQIVLEREPENTYDANAVKVIARWQLSEEYKNTKREKYTPMGNDFEKRVCIGYLPKEVAKRVAPVMDSGFANKNWVIVDSFLIETYRGTTCVSLKLAYRPDGARKSA